VPERGRERRVEGSEVVVVLRPALQFHIEVRRDALEGIVASAVERDGEGVGIGTEQLRRAVPLVDIAVDDQGPSREAPAAKFAQCDDHVVHQAVPACEVMAGVVRAAAEVHGESALHRQA